MRSIAPGGAGDGRTSSVELVLLLALMLLALGLRMTGIDYLLPAGMEQDGGVIVRQVRLLEKPSDDPWREESWSYYPHLVARATVLTTDPRRPLPREADVAAHLRAASDLHLRVRTVVAWISILIVPATWWLARRFVSRRAALFAAAASATSLLGLCLAQEARPHAPAAALAVLAVACALQVRARPSAVSYACAFLAAAAAIGTLQSGVAVVFALAVAHLLREGQHAGTRSARALSLLGALACCVVPIALAVVFLYPHGSPATATQEVSGIQLQSDGGVRFFGHRIFLDRFQGRGFANVWGTLVSFEPALLALALCGIVAWIAVGGRGRRRWSPDLCVALAYFVPYLLVIGLYQQTFERFVIQLVPGLACAAASGLDRLASLSVARRRLAWGLGLAALALSSVCSVRLVRLRGAPGTVRRAAAWIAEHVASDERVLLLSYFDVPLVRSPEAIADMRGSESVPELRVLSPWMRYQFWNRGLPTEPRFDLRTLRMARKSRDAQADPLASLVATGARWVVVPSVGANEPPAAGILHRALLDRAELAARIPQGVELDPTRAPTDLLRTPLDVGDSSLWWHSSWTWQLLCGDPQIGKVVEIFRLD